MPVHVLLVEDDLIDQRAFMRTLRDSQMECVCEPVFSTAEARAALEQQSFDVIVSDYQLGDGNALDLLPYAGQIPMIVVTGVGDEEIAVRALKSGVYDYLVKDYSHHYLKMLPVTIDTVLRRQRLEVDEREQRVLATALRDTALALTSTLELNEVLERILFNVKNVVPHDRANIMLLEGERARVVQTSDGYLTTLDMSCCPLTDAFHFGRMLYSLKPYFISDVAKASVDVYFGQVTNPASFLGAPLVSNDEVIGFINLDSWTANHFQSVYAERLQAFAAQATVALENARLYRHSSELAALQERQQIARDLHDSVTQTLFSASVMTESVYALWKRNPAQIESELLELHHLVRGALAEMRTLLFELRPDVLATANIYDLFQQLVDTFKGRTRTEIECELPNRESAPPLPPSVKIALFRIAQEALNNVVKHARAQRVRIHFESDYGDACLSVIDDGRGFDMLRVNPGRLGLKVMQERAQGAGVECIIHSQTGQGTEVIARWQSHEFAK